jgi:uncharacterized damage-inducible protein DinB
MTPTECRDVFGHMEWADALTWSRVLALPSLRQDTRTRDLLYHFHSTQWAYLQVWRGEPLCLPELSSFADLVAIASWARAYYRELPAYLQKLDEAALPRAVEFPFAAQVAERYGRAGPATLAETMLQIAMHSAQHRAQVASRVREHGGEPSVTDFIAWVWMERPAPAWHGL